MSLGSEAGYTLPLPLVSENRRNVRSMKDQWMFTIAMMLLVSMGLGGISVFSQQDSKENKGSKAAKERFRNAEKVLATHEAKLLSLPGVVGVGMGMTKKGNRPAIHLYVNVKATDGKIPAAIPKQIDKVPVRVIETDEIKAR
jgi:hypothetical protein